MEIFQRHKRLIHHLNNHSHKSEYTCIEYFCGQNEFRHERNQAFQMIITELQDFGFIEISGGHFFMPFLSNSKSESMYSELKAKITPKGEAFLMNQNNHKSFNYARGIFICGILSILFSLLKWIVS